MNLMSAIKPRLNYSLIFIKAGVARFIFDSAGIQLAFRIEVHLAALGHGAVMPIPFYEFENLKRQRSASDFTKQPRIGATWEAPES